MFGQLFRGNTGGMFGGMFARFTGYSFALPPSFDDSTLLLSCDGTNTDGTHKTDVINGYDMVAVEGPCLTLAIGDSIEMIGHGTFTSNTGTATFETYDGTTLTCAGAGTAFELKFSDGTIWPCSEGAGDAEDNVTLHDTTGQHSGAITVADTPLAMWTDTTQDVYMDGNDRGWHGINAPDDDGIYYPADPNTVELNMFQFEVVGDSTLTVDGTGYTVGTHTISGLSGATSLTVTYGVDDDQTVFAGVHGADVTGTSPNFSINMDESKSIIATMSEEVVGFSLTLAVTGDSTCAIGGTGYTITGSPHTITGLSGVTAMTIAYGGDDNDTNWSGTDSGDVTGDAQTWSITMDEDKSISCDCSEASLAITRGNTTFEHNIGSSVEIDTPSGISDGDLLVASITADSYGTFTHTGWTLIAQIDAVGSATGAMFYKIAASEDATQTFGFSASTDIICNISAYEKTSGAWDIDDFSTEADGFNTSTMPTVTSTDPGLLVLCSGCDDAGTIVTPPDDMTEIIKQDGTSSFLAVWDELVGAGDNDKDIAFSTNQTANIIAAIGVA